MILSDLPVGTNVIDFNTMYNYEPIVWRILEHGHSGDPSGSTALEARDIISLKCFDAKEPNNSNSNRKSYGNNRYLYSNLLQWLNSEAAANAWYTAQHTADQKPDSSNVWALSGTPINHYDTEAGFLTNFSSGLKTALQTASKVTAKNTVTDGGSYETVSSKIFLLSNTEVGLANENSVAEGSIYAYYSADNQNSRRIKNVANAAACGNYTGTSAGAAWYWWLRTPFAGNSNLARHVSTDGSLNSSNAFSGHYGVSPAMCVPSNTTVTQKDGVYYIFNEPLPSIKKVYANNNGVTKLIQDNTIPSFANATDAQLVDIINKLDSGKLTPDDTEWQVGDERTVHLSAMAATGVGEFHVEQDAIFVIVAKDTGVADSTNPCWNYQYVDQSGIRKWPSFIIQKKHGFIDHIKETYTESEYGYMNSSTTNSGSWNSCARRTWCNNIFRNAVPSTLVSIFKQVKVKTINEYNGSSITDSSDYFFLPAEREVFDSRANSNTNEWNSLSQWPYYLTASNRIKSRKNEKTSEFTTGAWWQRSPASGSRYGFCYVDSTGTSWGKQANDSYMIVPAGCI